MFIMVDLPEPDGPMTATSSPVADGEGDAAQGVDLHLIAHVIDFVRSCTSNMARAPPGLPAAAAGAAQVDQAAGRPPASWWSWSR